MANVHPLAVLAGALSALLSVSIFTGTFGGMMLSYLATLPLFLAGLSLGVGAAITASVSGAAVGLIASLVLGGGITAPLPYIALSAVPAAVLVQRALLSRTDQNGNQEWYPGGLLLAWLSGLAVAFFLAVLVLLWLIGSNLEATTAAIVGNMVTEFGLDADDQAQRVLAGYIAPGVTTSWMLMIIVNASLAQGVLARYKRNVRPSIGLSEIDNLPPALLGLFAFGAAASFLDGSAGMIGKTLAAIVAVPYFLLGLGFIHGFVRHLAWRTALLFLLYGLLFLLFLPMSLSIVGLGLMVHFGQVFRRGGGGGDRKEE